MSEITFKKLESIYGINRPLAAGFLLFLAMMPEGTTFKAVNGRLIKESSDTVRIIVDENTISDLAEEFLEEHIDVRDTLFQGDSEWLTEHDTQ
jgi:hypothetical protein